MSKSDRELAHELVRVSHETWEDLDVFATLLLKWQQTINLVAPSTLPKLWTRHIADSLQLIPYAETPRIWIDLGSGAGFPGLIVAIALRHCPDFHLHLIESDSRKCAFLREVIRITRAPATIHNKRINQALEVIDKADVVSARALASTEQLFQMSYPLLKKGARGLFLKGQDVEAELTEASKSWIIDAELRPSVTEPLARILIVKRLDPRS